jgi:hypothetical protein
MVDGRRGRVAMDEEQIKAWIGEVLRDDQSRPTPEQERLAAGPVSSTLESWRAGAVPLSLTEDDLELLDRVLCVYPELRIVTFLGQVARSRHVRYPVSRVEELSAAIGEDFFELGEHRIDAEELVAAMPREWFPINHEGELLSAIHLALLRCSVAAATHRVRNLGGLPPSRPAGDDGGTVRQP